MKTRYDIFGCLAALMGMLLGLYSCTDELEGMGNAVRPSDVVCFTASLSGSRTASFARSSSGSLEIEQEEWLISEATKQDISRGTPVSLLKGSAGIIGYVYKEWTTNTKPWTDLYNKKYNFDGDELTADEADVRWNTIAGSSNNDTVRFYLYAPFEVTNGGGGTLSTQETGGIPTLRYTVNDTITSQKDLIVASWKGYKGEHYGTDIQPKSIPLMFEHALTAVRFKIGFSCTITQLQVTNVYKSGTYSFDGSWEVHTTAAQGQSATQTYTFNFDNKSCNANDFITDNDSTLMMIPQTLPKDAQVLLTYKDANGAEHTITASLGGKVWQEGKMITYTIHNGNAPTTIYFDLAAGDITIEAGYTENNGVKTGKVIGYVYKKGETVATEMKYIHNDNNEYYVYQSTEAKRKAQNPTGVLDGENIILPVYDEVTYGNKPWREFITDNNNVEAVIEAWYVGMNKTQESKRADLKGRVGTGNYITVKAVADTKYNLIIQDVYSTYQDPSTNKKTGGITFLPATIKNCVLTVTTLGDNRFGNIFYYNKPDNFIASSSINTYSKETYIENNINNGSKICFEGTGSLTVADVLENKSAGPGWSGTGYFANHYCAAIGGNDDATHEQSSGIEINSGIIWAGTTAAENCTAIGGGGNGFGEVIINGGTVTAVASTTGTAIGGGIGYSSHGGEGRVHINGGNVYAYNLDNKRRIPSSAIGGAGSSASVGTWGTVNITGGYVYAYSALGTAIGGGSSEYKSGGNAVITITGGQVIAKSGSGAGIGGGSSYTKNDKNNTENFNGGTATINISGNPVIRTGSIGGGNTGANNGKIGSADITISGGDIQAQFVMAAGAKATPSFTMNGGTIRNSYTDDEEYLHIKQKGGAVYLEDGIFTMTGGTIKNCSAVQGGAVYIERKSTKPMGEEEFNFKMTGGEIHSCFSTGGTIDGVTYSGHGGAVCLNGGQVLMSGGEFWNNYSVNGDGGAIYISNGNFFMKDGLPEIYSNAAQKGNGGGVFVASLGQPVQVDLIRGVITNNTASNYGGGVCVDMGATSYEANVTVGKTGQGVTKADADPKISDNISMMSGGGLYVRGTNANITINSGMIDENKVSAYVKNQNVANEGGAVELNDGLVTHVVVTYKCTKGGKYNDSDIYTQNIVKDTNSKLKANCFERDGYTFVAWNTHKDGIGDTIPENFAEPLSEDITLYPIWKAD